MNQSIPTAITEIRRCFHRKNFGRLKESKIFVTNYNPSDKKKEVYINVSSFKALHSCCCLLGCDNVHSGR